MPALQIKRPASGPVKLLALATLVLLAACGREPEAVAPEVRPVRTMTIANSVSGNTVVLTGRVQARADVSGVVTARGPEVGEVVAAGQMIVQIAQSGAADAIFDVPAPIKNNASRASTIWVAMTSDPGIRTKGSVREVSPRADPVTGTFRVRVSLADAPAAMRLGSTVTGRLELDAVPGIAIPAVALTRVDGKPAVWVVDTKTSTVALRRIEIRSEDATIVQVRSGLNPGDVVVTAGVQVLRPGQKVSLLGSVK